MANRFGADDSDEEESKQQEFGEPLDLLDTNPVYTKPPVAQQISNTPDLLGSSITTEIPVLNPILGSQPLSLLMGTAPLNPSIAL